MKYDISILIPAIRTNRWLELYNSAILACHKHTWEIIFIGPFDPPKELQNKENIQYIKEYGYVSRAVQRGMLFTKSNLVFLTVDDCSFAKDSIDICLQTYKQVCRKQDVLNMRYSENGDIQQPSYYTARFHRPLQLDGIKSQWQIAMQFLMNVEHFKELGGFDCQFEYINEPVHDFMFRLQKNGGNIYHSPVHVCMADWYYSTTGDHAPVHYAQTSHDWPIFAEIYKHLNDRIFIDYDNWKNTPEIWNRRFSKGKCNSYEELILQEEYQI